MQVFIKTISDHTVKKSEIIEFGDRNDDETRPSAPLGEVVLPVNYCGCTERTTAIMAITCTILFIAFWAIAAFALSNTIGGLIFFLLSTISLITAITGCVLRCCSCCKPPVDVD